MTDTSNNCPAVLQPGVDQQTALLPEERMLTIKETAYIRILRGIEGLPECKRRLVYAVAEKLRDTICLNGPDGLLALSLITAELTARK